MNINLFKNRGKSATAEAPVTEPEQNQEAGEKTNPAAEETELREALRELREALRELREAVQELGSRLRQGSIWMCQRCGRGVAAWCSAGRRDDLEGIAAEYGVWLRGAVLLGAAYGAWKGVTAAPWVPIPAAGVWLLASLYAKAPAEPEGEAEEQKGEGAESAAEDEANVEGSAAPPVEEPPLPSHEDLHDALAQVGTPHAHIAALAEALNVPAESVRQALTALSVPVEPVRMKGRGSSTGIRADRFPAPPPAPEIPLEDVVAAGQEANNNDNNVQVRRYAGGAHITVTPAQRGA
ncbi:hypothetical protein ACWD6K_31400 [Streptomyces sp. NPDC002431]